MGSVRKLKNETQIIKKYISDLKPRIDKIRATNNTEESLRPVFIELLNRIGSHKNLWVVAEDRLKNNKKPDASIKNLYMIHGYYEAKSPDKNLDQEVKEKIRSGYPLKNIIFENSEKCILYQNGKVKKEIENGMWSNEALGELLVLFFNFENEEVKQFNSAQRKFGENLPFLTKEIEKEVRKLSTNRKYIKKINDLVSSCQKFINPYFKKENVEAWLIQHILTEQIFLKVFDEQEYHKSNNISKAICEIEKEFLSEKKQDILERIKPYIAPITNYGNNIIDLRDRQLFLKKFYQDFYNSYEKKKADTLGIIYTPNEIVKFMVESTDDILKRHFNKRLKDKNVHILDPATGTATYITELIEYIHHTSNSERVKYKYKNEIHANEISVLPYYVANLSIEYTFKQLTNKREKFNNLVLMDSLQNSHTLQGQMTFDGLMFNENQKRVKKQNKKNIQILIGNPPYNQNQRNFRDNNPNKKYPEIKKRIDETYGLKEIYALNDCKKRKVTQDKYISFLRWASDRLDNQGIISFITNRSYLDASSGICVRHALEKEFDFIYIIDLEGNIRGTDPSDSNVFDIQTGVAICFLVKTKESNEKARIKYLKISDIIEKDLKSYKLAELNQKSIEKYLLDRKFKIIKPNEKYQWINQEDENTGLSIRDIFEKSFLGVVTNRDKDVFDKDKSMLEKENENYDS